MMITPDRYAFSNPAFGAVTLHWLAAAYDEKARNLGHDVGVHLPHALLALAILGPEEVRNGLPSRANSKLALHFTKNPELVAALPFAMAQASQFFWPSVRLGLSSGMLRMVDSRLSAEFGAVRARGSEQVNVYQKAKVLGKLLAHQYQSIEVFF